MSAPSLNDFVSAVKQKSLARQNRFTVNISKSTDNLVQLFCEQAVLPSISFASQPVKTYGEERQVIYDRNFESITLTFLVDRQMQIKNYFDQWTYEMVDPKTRIYGYYDKYIRTIEIITQDTKDNNTYKTTLYEAYPKTIASVQLDHNSKDVMKLQVTFNYKYHINDWIPSPENDKDPKKLFGITVPDPYKLTQQFGNYIRSGVESVVQVPNLYFDNFQQFQDSISSNSQLERQGQTTGSGAMDWY